MPQLRQIFNRRLLLIASTLFSLPAFAVREYNLPEPASTITREIYDLHMLTAWVATVIMIIVTGIIVYALINFRKSKGYKPDMEFNHTWFGRWSWALVPAIVLGIDFSIAGSATKTLRNIESHDPAEVTVKVTGSQWKWTYEYMDDDIKIVSNLNKDIPSDDVLYLRDVDNRLVLPTNKRVRFLHTATDVLHAWWVPAISYKKDSIPGYINETWTVIDKEGVYRGQCAENCGTGHAYMPIVVEAVSPEKYDEWMNGQKVAMAAATAEASADKTWELAELMERGEKLYNTNCAACHMPTGAGIPGVFPALKGSPVAMGEMSKHINTVVKGVAGTAMAAWGNQLNDLELAAIVTYERNAWGNNTGDSAQPADIKAAR
ncbi:MAG: cytochrome c oxidase subunit II [Gammaproteobacteria bacterium]|jgi:cytochrome c oxidase subunit 2|nr:cytochrome c oxidase subunit II [Gammaproteobacteria bacterium]MBT3726004.1 cytochrome c oxidase subunit II [Gammaproteobacteria bacterium]MBT4075135.1 cytochrome c oxidase subunit II [Gammaproteobacteria bacterium]MBT4195277.1 cytochrome c oxidase subunit II [Gammaproteobacteria bacterium]MBT4448620.1 cytochrome c oxidase subunit II [Gammaproteobacteria bacterium]